MKNAVAPAFIVGSVASLGICLMLGVGQPDSAAAPQPVRVTNLRADPLYVFNADQSGLWVQNTRGTALWAQQAVQPWEYRIESIATGTAQQLQVALDGPGGHGWELVGESSGLWIFKKPKAVQHVCNANLDCPAYLPAVPPSIVPPPNDGSAPASPGH
jgi:hypothetical protein